MAFRSRLRRNNLRMVSWLMSTVFGGVVCSTPSAVATDPARRPVQIPARLTAFEAASFDVATLGATTLGSDNSSKAISSSDLTPPTSTVHSHAGGASIPTSHLARLLTRMVIHSIPPVYNDERHWNKERDVWNGVHVRLHNGKLETHRKTKEVKAGTWTRYTMRIDDPEKQVHVQFDRLEVTKEKGMSFAVTVEADLDLDGQLNEWARDIRLYSISARADASIRLQVEGTIQLKMNGLKLPPDFTVVPQVDHAHLDLISYRVKEVSNIRGDAAKLIGKSLKAAVRERLEIENQKLVAKINRKLAQRSHKMTISGDDWLKPRKSASNSSTSPTEKHR